MKHRPVTSPRPPVFDQGPTSADTKTMDSGGCPGGASAGTVPSPGDAAAVTT